MIQIEAPNKRNKLDPANIGFEKKSLLAEGSVGVKCEKVDD